MATNPQGRVSDRKAESLESFRQTWNLISIGIGQSTSTDEMYQAAGLRKKGCDEPLTTSDRIPIMSITKAMTATLIMLLVKDGLLSWDSTLGSLFPDLSNLHSSLHDLDVKNLAAHRSGITKDLITFGHRHPWQDPKLPAVEGRRLMIQEVLSKPAGAARGTFKYNNMNYIILGAIVDRVTASSYETVIMDRLFKPLGMESVVFGQSPETGPVPIGHWPHPLPFFKPVTVSSSFQRFTAMVPAVNPAGGVRCSLADVMKFLRLHARGVHGSGALGLTEADFRFLHTPFTTEDVRGDMERYTYGGWVRPYDEDHGGSDYCIQHPGGFWFFSSRAYVDVKTGTCYTAMTNMSLWNANKALDKMILTMRKGGIAWQEVQTSKI